GLVRHHRRAERLEPDNPFVEPLEDELLEQRIPAGALRAELLERPVAPDHAAREEHRAAGAVALLEDDGSRPELARPRGRRQAGHAGAGDAQVNENVGLCSTYSTRTRSGPQRKTAYVFAASTTLSISMPASRASTRPTRRPSRVSKYASPGRGHSTSSPAGSLANASSRSFTRSATCFSAPRSRGPSAAKSVSLPRRASDPTSVKASVRSMTCIP